MNPPQPNMDEALEELSLAIDNREVTKDLLRAEGNRGAIHQDVDNSKNKNLLLPWFVLLALVAAYGAGVSTALMLEMVGNRADLTAMKAEIERELDGKISPLQQSNDMLVYYVMELDGKLMHRRSIRPEESWSAQQLQRAKTANNSSSKETKTKL